MKQLNAIIIEDEKNGQEALTALLEMYCPQVNITGIAEGVSSGISLVLTLQPDVVFLDIMLGTENGFDLLEKLQPTDFQIIFTTSSDSYALRAFKANAIDYLMKPIEPNRLIKAVEKVEKLKGTTIMQEQLTHLLHSMQQDKIERLSIPSRKDGISILEVQNIVYLEGSGTYTTFFMTNGKKVTASNNLGHFQDLLPRNIFYRVHQSYAVHIKYIKRILTSDSLLELSNGEQIPIARSRRSGLMMILGI